MTDARRPMRLRLLILGLMLSGACGTTTRASPIDPNVVEMVPPTEVEANVERYIGFTDPSQCQASPAFEHLLWAMLPTDGTRMVEPAMPDLPISFTAHAANMHFTRSEGGMRTLTVAMDDRWHGLHLTQLSRWMGDSLDVAGFTLTFSDDEAQVRSTLNAMGFDLPAEGAKQIGDEMPFSIRVVSVVGGTLLSCGVS